MNAADAKMQREAAPANVAGLTLSPLTIPRMNAASAMRISVFSLDESQRATLATEKTYRGIIRDIIIVFYLCSHGDDEAAAALWEPVSGFKAANAFAEKHRISEASPDYVAFQCAFWALVNPIFENDSIPVGQTELGTAKKKPLAT